MRVTKFVLLLTLVLSLAGLTACAGGGGGEPMVGAGKTMVDDIADGEAAEGNVRITWRNLNEAHQDVTVSLVNESSDFGRQLQSGRVTSTVTRLATDDQVGDLIATMRELGFFVHATPMVLGQLPETPGRKGAVVVEQDGQSVGLMLVRKQGLQGSPIPGVYTDCKRLIVGLHSSLQGLEVRQNVDADDVFRSPPIRPGR